MLAKYHGLWYQFREILRCSSDCESQLLTYLKLFFLTKTNSFTFLISLSDINSMELIKLSLESVIRICGCWSSLGLWCSRWAVLEIVTYFIQDVLCLQGYIQSFLILLIEDSASIWVLPSSNKLHLCFSNVRLVWITFNIILS